MAGLSPSSVDHADPAPKTDGNRAVVARARLPLARQALALCRLCPHDCRVNRLDLAVGRCGAGAGARFFSAQIEVGDELELLPTYAVALSGCSLRCAFCITGESSWNAHAGHDLDAQAMARQASQALNEGVRTVMILGGEPTVHVAALLELVGELPPDAWLVLKTHGWFGPPVRQLLAGLFQVWLPDLKFGNDRCAERLAGIPAYWETLTGNLVWMATHDPCAEVMVRHLLMPGHVDCCWKPAARWLATSLPRVKVSLRASYWPAWQARRHGELGRVLSRAEKEQGMTIARDFGLNLVPS